MMDDLISRQAAIDAVKEKVFHNLNDEFYGTMQVLNELPSAQPLTEEDYIELHDRFGSVVEFVVRDMISGEGKRWKT